VDRQTYMSAVDQQIALTRSNRLFHQNYDLLVTPTLAVAAFEVGRNVPAGYDTVNWMSWTPFTYPFNLTGQPAATVPCGLTSEGLPVGLQFVGDLYADGLVLQAASLFETVSPFGRALPGCLQTY
jgi:aspartyl-tRNA(Asn)/glutamyl-tRNA(Gln) amidotransferase subunit A